MMPVHSNSMPQPAENPHVQFPIEIFCEHVERRMLWQKNIKRNLPALCPSGDTSVSVSFPAVLKIAYPVFTVQWINSTVLLVAGGGGRSFGIPNAVQYIFLHPSRTPPISNEHRLPTEVAPQTDRVAGTKKGVPTDDCTLQVSTVSLSRHQSVWDSLTTQIPDERHDYGLEPNSTRIPCLSSTFLSALSHPKGLSFRTMELAASCSRHTNKEDGQRSSVRNPVFDSQEINVLDLTSTSLMQPNKKCIALVSVQHADPCGRMTTLVRYVLSQDDGGIKVIEVSLVASRTENTQSSTLSSSARISSTSSTLSHLHATYLPCEKRSCRARRHHFLSSPNRCSYATKEATTESKEDPESKTPLSPSQQELRRNSRRDHAASKDDPRRELDRNTNANIYQDDELPTGLRSESHTSYCCGCEESPSNHDTPSTRLASSRSLPYVLDMNTFLGRGAGFEQRRSENPDTNLHAKCSSRTSAKTLSESSLGESNISESRTYPRSTCIQTLLAVTSSRGGVFLYVLCPACAAMTLLCSYHTLPPELSSPHGVSTSLVPSSWLASRKPTSSSPVRWSHCRFDPQNGETLYVVLNHTSTGSVLLVLGLERAHTTYSPLTKPPTPHFCDTENSFENQHIRLRYVRSSFLSKDSVTALTFFPALLEQSDALPLACTPSSVSPLRSNDTEHKFLTCTSCTHEMGWSPPRTFTSKKKTTTQPTPYGLLLGTSEGTVFRVYLPWGVCLGPHARLHHAPITSLSLSCVEHGDGGEKPFVPSPTARCTTTPLLASADLTRVVRLTPLSATESFATRWVEYLTKSQREACMMVLTRTTWVVALLLWWVLLPLIGTFLVLRLYG